MTSGAMIIGFENLLVRSRCGYHDVTLFHAMQEYLTTGRPTVIYAYYPSLNDFEDIPHRLRDSYLEEHDNV